MMDLLNHVQDIGGEVYGSPIVANANQADGWIKFLTSPIEIKVDYVEGKVVDFNTMPTGSYPTEKGSASIAKYDNQNCLKINASANVRIIDESKIKSDSVQLLTTVTIRNTKNQQQMTYTIVSENEANLKEHKLSITTPVAKGLLGKKKGEKAVIKLPVGEQEFEVVDITV
jgi:hypothetical protein